MAVSTIQVEFQAEIEKVWEKVVSLEDYSWRSDLDRIEVLEPGKRFVEYTKEGFATTFTITAFVPFKRYEFDMENENMKGHWIGLFSHVGGKTVMEFTEDVTAKKWPMRPFVKAYLKKQQAQYAADLEQAL